MAYEDFTTYDETDDGTNVTVIASKVSWNNLDKDETSHVSDSKGVDYFSGDFIHRFEIQFSDVTAEPLMSWWALANAQTEYKTLIDASANFVAFGFFPTELRLEAIVGGGVGRDVWTGASASTTYYITLSRDDDGGAATNGLYTAEIRTGSHTGTLVDTLTKAIGVGGARFDFEYVYGLMSADYASDGHRVDGFTQNLDLDIVLSGEVGTGAMTTNTKYWT